MSTGLRSALEDLANKSKRDLQLLSSQLSVIKGLELKAHLHTIGN